MLQPCKNIISKQKWNFSPDIAGGENSEDRDRRQNMIGRDMSSLDSPSRANTV